MLRTLVPWRERFPLAFPRFEREMEEMMERAFGEGNGWEVGKFAPEVNVAETEKEFEVTMELPGLKPEEVNVELKNEALWITGEKREEKEEKGKTFHRTERRYGEFRRTIPLPGTVNEEKVKAHFENGLLKVTIPKSEEAKPKRIPIKT